MPRWEPIESFEESEDIIGRFWDRVNSGGRDFRKMQLFKAGEVFVPVGPPRTPCLMCQNCSQTSIRTQTEARRHDIRTFQVHAI